MKFHPDKRSEQRETNELIQRLHARVAHLESELAAAKALLALPESVEPAAAEKAREWQPIETAPKDRRILLWWSTCKYPAVGRWHIAVKHEGWKCDADDCIPRNQHHCTHWMGLPSPPAATG